MENVEFLKGQIESIPLPDNSVDVIISNCVINLSADKDRVLREAFRVLKPGGRFAVSDVVTRGEIPAEIREHVLLWVGCLAGALDGDEYRGKLAAAGFEGIDVEPTRVYRVADAREFLSGKGLDVDAIAPLVDEKFFSGFIRARKPAASCCGPTCCACVRHDCDQTTAVLFRALPVPLGGLCMVGGSVGKAPASGVDSLRGLEFGQRKPDQRPDCRPDLADDHADDDEGGLHGHPQRRAEASGAGWSRWS